MMMIANLIGFCVGLDGILDLLKGIVGSYYGMSIQTCPANCRIGICTGSVCFVIYWYTGHV